MAFPKFQTKEVLNKVLNTGEDALKVDLSDSVTVTVDSEFPAAAALADNSGNPTTTSVGSHLLGYDSGNTNWNRVEVDDVGHLQVDVLTITAGDNNIGNVDIASIAAGDNNIGNVDIASSVALTVDLGSNNDIKIASGQVESGAFASGALASGSVVDGAMVTLGAKADAKSTATDTTAITAMQVLKQISASTQETATDTGTIDADTNAIKGHVDGIETLITSTNTKLDTLETTNNANQVLLGTIDSDTNDTKTALNNMLYGTAVAITAVDGGSNQDIESGATYEALYIGVGGDVTVTLATDTEDILFKNLASGQLLPIRLTDVKASNTTATHMIALKA
jgi:hypothetical protein